MTSSSSSTAVRDTPSNMFGPIISNVVTDVARSSITVAAVESMSVHLLGAIRDLAQQLNGLPNPSGSSVTQHDMIAAIQLRCTRKDGGDTMVAKTALRADEATEAYLATTPASSK